MTPCRPGGAPSAPPSRRGVRRDARTAVLSASSGPHPGDPVATSDPVRQVPSSPEPGPGEPDGPAPDGGRRLARGSMGPLELTFFVVAAAGPLLIVAGYAPLAFL